jgi:hypothetical protein
VFAGLALAAAAAVSVAARNPGIAVATGCGVAAIGLVLLLVRLMRGSRRAKVWVAVGFLGLLGLCAVGTSLYVLGAREPNPGQAVPTQTAEYFASGGITDGQITVDESIVIRGSKPLSQAEVSGWDAAAPVDGFPSFRRTRTLSWDHTSFLADTVRLPIDIGTLTATTDGNAFHAQLAPQRDSRVRFRLAKGALGSAVPAPTAHSEALSGEDLETVIFTVDQYVIDVSFDVLRPPLRNPAGHAVYEASLWGFWQWAAGAAGAVISGVVVDKLGGALWSSLARLGRAVFRRRASATSAGT